MDPTSPMVLAKLLLISAAWLVLRRSGEALCVMLQQSCLHLSLHTTTCKSVFIIDQSSVLCLAREKGLAAETYITEHTFHSDTKYKRQRGMRYIHTLTHSLTITPLSHFIVLCILVGAFFRLTHTEKFKKKWPLKSFNVCPFSRCRCQLIRTAQYLCLLVNSVRRSDLRPFSAVAPLVGFHGLG